jgi:hypothetical protein
MGGEELLWQIYVDWVHILIISLTNPTRKYCVDYLLKSIPV